MSRRLRLVVATSCALALSALVRLFVVHVIDHAGGVELIALRARPGWSVENHMPTEVARAQGHIVLVRGNENGVAGENLLRANGYAVWVLLVALVISAIGLRAPRDD